MAEPTSLPILSCDGCGVCCTNMCAPQYGWYFAAPDQVPQWRKETADFKLIQDMPDDLRQELADLYAGDAMLDTIPAPCVWLNPETQRCRHYDWRPTLCRDFEMGGAACRTWRESAGIALPMVDGDTPKERPACKPPA